MAIFSKQVAPSKMETVQVYTKGVATKVGTVVLATYAIRTLDALARMAAGGIVSLVAKRKAAKLAAAEKARWEAVAEEEARLKAEASTVNPESVDPALFEVDPDIVGALLKRSEEVASQEAASNG